MNPKLLSVQSERAKCRFPEWTQGKWDRVKIEGNLFKFKDIANQYRTLTSKCIMRQTDTPNDRFIIQSTTQWLVLNLFFFFFFFFFCFFLNLLNV